MSLTFKLASLAIRTVAKPIGNQIKKQASEHPGFRTLCINNAQRLHRIDMRMRLGILHDTAAQERMHAREERKAEEKRRMAETPTVLTEAAQKAKDEAPPEREEKREEYGRPPKVKIRPLSEAKAIELGANFFSEAFIFAVAAGLLVFDSWRSRRKESARRDDVAERLEDLEMEVERLRSRYEPELVALEKKREIEEERRDGRERRGRWWNVTGWFGAWQGEVEKDDEAAMEKAKAEVKRMREVAEVAKVAAVRGEEKEGKGAPKAGKDGNDSGKPKEEAKATEENKETASAKAPLVERTVEMPASGSKR